MSDPRRFDEGEATEFERQLFEAANRQVPSAALKARMRQGLGLAAPSAAAPAAAKTFALSGKTGAFLGLVVIGAAVTAFVVTRDRHPTTVTAPARPLPDPSPMGPSDLGAIDDPAQPNAAASSAAGSLTDEIHLLDRARAALSSGAPRRALEVLEQYDQRYPRGRFAPESVVLRVEALAAAGETQAARALGQQFLAQHPTNPLAGRVAKIVGR